MQDSVKKRPRLRRWHWLTALLAVVVAGGLWFSTLKGTGNKAASAEASAHATDWANEPVVVNLPKIQSTTEPDKIPGPDKSKTPDKTP